jgi:DNA repair exonuclease SbcCD ATPase subunit
MLKKYSQVSVNIEYVKKESREAKVIAKGVSLASYEKSWIDENVKGNKVAVHKKMRSILNNIPAEGTANKEFQGLYIKRFILEDFQAIEKADKTFSRNDCIGIIGEVNGERVQSNGTGKSSFVEGIRWILHGVTRFSKNVSAIQDDKDSVYGELIFESAKKDIIRIVRELSKKDSKSFAYVNEELVAKGAKVSQWVDENFGGNLKVFDNLISRGAGSKSLVGGKPTERLKSVQEPLPLERYTKKALDIVRKERSAMSKLVNSFEGIVDEFSELENQKETINQSREKLKKLNKEKDTLKKNFKKVEREQSKVHDLKDSLYKKQNLLDKIDDLKKSLSVAELDLNKLDKKKDLTKIETRGRTIAESIDVLRSDQEKWVKEIAKKEASIDVFNEKIDLLKTGLCDTCGSNVSQSHIDKMKSKYIDARRKIDDILSKDKKKLGSIKKEIDSKNRELDVSRNEYLIIRDNNRAIDRCVDNINNFKRDLKKSESDYSKIIIKNVRIKTIKDADAELKKLEKDYKKHRSEFDSVQDSIYELSGEIDQFDSDWSRYQKAKISLEKKRKELIVLNMCYDAFSPKGIPHYIVTKIIEETNDVIPMVINDFGFWNCSDVILEPRSDSIGIWTVINEKPQREYEGLSAGEREVSNFIVVESYKRVLQNLVDLNYNFVLIDEALDNLDCIQFYCSRKL